MSSNESQLSNEFRQKALSELREDDLRKQQALEQFRDWILKQGHISNCRTDDNFLLRFLRLKKYTNSAAFKMLENLLLRSQQHPNWFSNMTLNDETMSELIKSAFVVPLVERDENGCRVILFEASKIDIKKYTFDDVMKAFNFVIFILSEEEETQIAGFKFILNFKDISTDFVSFIPLMSFKNYLTCVNDAIPARQKKAVFINLPVFFAKVVEFVKSFLSKKLKDRGYFYSDDSQLKSHFDEKILPSEYGGEKPIKEMLEEFKKIAKKYESKVQATANIKIDPEYVKKHDNDAIQSFRSLEID